LFNFSRPYVTSSLRIIPYSLVSMLKLLFFLQVSAPDAKGWGTDSPARRQDEKASFVFRASLRGARACAMVDDPPKPDLSTAVDKAQKPNSPPPDNPPPFDKKRRAETFRAAAAWCLDGDRTALEFRAEAHGVVKGEARDPLFVALEKRHEEIVNTPAKELAFHEKQVSRRNSLKRVKQKILTKPWHEDADPVLDKLRAANPNWTAGRLQTELDKHELPDLPEPPAQVSYIKKRFPDLPKRTKNPR
jgi:hypothetical protein